MNISENDSRRATIALSSSMRRGRVLSPASVGERREVKEMGREEGDEGGFKLDTWMEARGGVEGVVKAMTGWDGDGSSSREEKGRGGCECL